MQVRLPLPPPLRALCGLGDGFGHDLESSFALWEDEPGNHQGFFLDHRTVISGCQIFLWSSSSAPARKRS